tara:strand:+ start:372 stop:611 length:240 start_codon:yes stop_codon:yes gene_type:complete
MPVFVSSLFILFGIFAKMMYSRQNFFRNLESDLIAIGISVALSLGGIFALSSGFDDDDDQDGGGTGSPVYEPLFAGNPA